jgi:very-short-patch-repair endonuclease
MLLEKICKTCKESKKIEEYYFNKQKNRHESDCKKCYQKKKSAKREERIKNGAPRYIAKKKKCIDCGHPCDARPRILRCYSCSSKYQYKTHPSKSTAFKDGYKKLAQNNEYKKMLSEQMKEQRNSIAFIEALSKKFPARRRLSSVHKKIKNSLFLESLGFKSEQVVNKYFADELHENKKIIIEINGDYVHANPSFYSEEDIILLPNARYTAKEKWESDKNKRENLEKLGYKVIVIWESDDMEEKRKEIMELLK